MSPRAALLNTHGGAKWGEVKRLQKLGAASADDPVAGEKAYREALAALPGALAEARAAEQAEAEKARQEKVAALVAAARAAKATGRWQTCIDKAGEALALETEGRAEEADGGRVSPRAAEAAALKREADDHLKPKGPQPGDVQMVDLGGGVRLELVWIPPGTFMMGSPESETGRDSDETQHRVTLTNGFWMGKYEVTQAQWEAVMGSNPSRFKNAGRDAPVERVSWNDCQAFVQKLNERIPGGGFRLPTEAEWEYACRAGTTTALYTGPLTIRGARNGPELDAIAWYGGNSGVDYEGGYDSSGWPEKQYNHKRAGTHSVGQKKPNAWGLHDMLGNVWEWCEDGHEAYPSGSVTNPVGSGSRRVFRGGCWNYYAGLCRSASRHWCDPCRSGYNLGLRLVRNPR